MTNKGIFSLVIAMLVLTASFGIAAPRGGSVAPPAMHSAPAPAPIHAAPTANHPISSPTFHHHHHGHGVVVFYDDFGDPFWPYWWGWGYPYPYGAYYNGVPSSGGSVVVQVQERLARAGYYHGAIDGELGPRTHSAIRRFERSHGLHVDGEISDELLVAMGFRYNQR